MVSDTELISVVIPVFNAEAFVVEAVESVRRQGYPCLEIIAVDDGSSDRSAEVLAALGDIRIVRQQHAGIAAARNAGVEAATGQWLTFLDADDVWCDHKLERQLHVVCSQPELHMVGGRIESFIDPSCPPGLAAMQRGPTKYLAEDRHDSATPENLATVNAVGTLLIRRQDFLRVGKFDTTLQIGEFIDWHSRAMVCGLREHVIDATVLRRRIHGNNTTLRQRAAFGDFLSVVKLHLNRKRSDVESTVPAQH
jgi:glycosyltransferase involved in cell wall biosynthesis